MKIKCPICKTGYQVNFPHLDEAGVQVECAKCHNHFLVKPEMAASHAASSSYSEPEEDLVTDSSYPNEEEFQDASQEEPPSGQENSEPQDLDRLLDDILGEDSSDSMQDWLNPTSAGTETESENNSESETGSNSSSQAKNQELLEETALSLEDLSNLPNSPDSSKLDEDEMDRIWEEAVQEGSQEELLTDEDETGSLDSNETGESKNSLESIPVETLSEDQQTHPPAKVIQNESDTALQTKSSLKEMDETETDMSESPDETLGEARTVEESSKEALKETNPPNEELNLTEEDVLEENEAIIPNETSSEQISNQDETQEAVSETGPEENKEESDEDLWAKAFEEQDELNEKMSEESTGESATDDSADDESEDDLWAKAFAEQEELNEKMNEEPTTESTTDETPEESEDDLWAKAFAEQDELNEKMSEESTGESATDETPEESEDDLWAKAFAEQDELNEKMSEESTGESATAETPEESEDDLWAKAFAEQEELNEKMNEEPTTESATDDSADDESDEDLWAKAFAEQEELNEKMNEDSSNDSNENVITEEAASEMAPSDSDEDDSGDWGTATDLAEDEGSSSDDSELGDFDMEAAYADDDDDDDFPTELKKKKFLGIFPNTKTGKLIALGSVAGLLLALGGGYFAYKTFLPSEIAEEMQASAPDSKEAEDNQDPTKSNEESSDAENDKDPNETGKNTNLVNVLEEKADLKSGKEKPKGEEALVAALSPRQNSITMSSIMPVAFSPKELKVLSMTLEIEMSNPETAEAVRGSLPIYEKIMVDTIESFLKRKFYNDVLYVKEKLKKRLMVSFNKSEQGKSIKKIRFKDFSVD